MVTTKKTLSLQVEEKHIIMELEHTPINSKACVNCNNVEGDLISVCLEGLQSLIEYSKIRSNASLLNYFMEQLRNNMPNEVFVYKNCSHKYTSPLQKKWNKKILLMTGVLNQLFFNQRESFNWKTHCFLCEHGPKLCDILKLSKFSVKKKKNEITLKQKAEWTWNYSCCNMSSFQKACSFDCFFFFKVLILWLLRKICCSPWLAIKNTIEKLLTSYLNENKAYWLL